MSSNASLLEALERADLEGVQAALSAGADPNLREDGCPVLCTVAGRCHAEAVRLLLTFGADANAKDRYGRTALMWTSLWAERADPVGTLDALHVGGASLDAADHQGQTALDVAAHLENLVVVRWLLGHAAKGSRASLIAGRRLLRDGLGPSP